MVASIDVLQMGPYPESDQAPLDAGYTMHRYFEAGDKAAFVAHVAPCTRAIATSGKLGANRGLIEALPNPEIISVSRASNIDEDPLIEAPSQNRLGSAALDVFEGEPALDRRFLALHNVLLQPHHASGTFETRKAMGKLLRDNLTAQFNRELLLTPVL